MKIAVDRKREIHVFYLRKPYAGWSAFDNRNAYLENGELCVDLFAYQGRKAVGALTTNLGGHDRMVFTGGIGEHAAPVRGSICRGMEYLGIRLDPVRNAASDPRISADGSDCEVLVIPRHDDRIIAQHCRRVLTNLENTP